MKIKIYMLPGIMCNEKLWKRLLVYFDESFELIHLDIPLKNSFDEMADVLNEIIPDKKINLIGFSLGGYLASYFACKYTNRVNKLFLMGSSSCALSKEEIVKRKKVIDIQDQFSFKGLSRKKIQSLLCLENQNNEELIHTIGQMYIELGKEVFKIQLGATLYRDDLLEKLSILPIYKVAIYSSDDRLVNKEWIKAFSKRSINTKFITFESASHMLPLEKPFEIAQEIKKWIKEKNG